MKATQKITRENAEIAANELAELFPVSTEKIVYSLGYERRLKLKKAIYQQITKELLISGCDVRKVDSEIQSKLASLTDQEFKALCSKK